MEKPARLSRRFMIPLFPAENDDLAFLSLAQRIVNGASGSLRVREVYLVHVDNWFDHKWLGWWSVWKHKKLKELCIPPFNPNRIRSQQHFTWDPSSSRWLPEGEGKPLHSNEPKHASPRIRLLDRVSKSA